MLLRKRFPNFSLWCLAGMILSTAATLAMAAPEEGAPRKSIFSQFFTTENMVGTMIIWGLVLSSVGLMAIIIQTAMATRKEMYSPPDVFNEVENLLAEKRYREAIDIAAADKSPFGQMMSAALNEAPRGYTSMVNALEEGAESIGGQRVRQLVYLEVAGAAGPMVGLFGTVFGMILTFSELVAQGGSPKAGALAGGIATSLVCTFWGLVVGIPGVITASLFRVLIEGLIIDTNRKAMTLVAQFRPAPGKKKA
jgi:biopolymer transport protein ExbB